MQDDGCYAGHVSRHATSYFPLITKLA